MRFLYGQGWVEEEKTDADTGGAGGAAGEGAPAGDGAGGEGDLGTGAPAESDKGAPAGDKHPPAGDTGPKDMLEAIDIGLKYKKPDAEDPEAKKAAEAAAAAAAAEKWPSGAPKKNAKGEDLDEQGKVVPLKAKTAAELALKPNELAALKPETRERFQQVISTLKAKEAENATLLEQIKPLREARDDIFSVLKETNTSQDQLFGYLEFNALLASNDPKNWEAALKMVEEQRAALYQALGREPEQGGLDLLAAFPDLVKEVEEERMTRKYALEVAQARRDKTAREQQANAQQQNQRQREEQASAKQREAEGALKEIEKWTLEQSQADLDYKAKEDKLMPQLKEILKEYEPKLWLSTIKRLYAGIVVQRAPGPGAKEKQPIRPSGTKGGAAEPANMLEAINTGLGYAKKD